MHIEAAWRAIIEHILSEHVPDREVVLFGSRASGKPKPYSDIDLCVLGKDPVPSKTLSALRMAFSESDLPVRVDMVDWASANSEFQKTISKNCKTIFSP